MENSWNNNYRGKPKYIEKNLSQCQFSTTNPTWNGLGSIAVLRGEKPATNLSYILCGP
jgi:hypothetical protein